MTGKERISRILKKRPVDRVGVFEHFWNDTQSTYVRQSHVGADESLIDHFNLDIQEDWAFNLTADIDFKDTITAQTDDTITIINGNGATLRRHKHHDSTPEHVDFKVKTSRDWDRYRTLLTHVDERRINFEKYRAAKEKARESNRFFVWSGVNVFESIHPLCGHENMLIGMALEPEWILDLAETYANLILSLQEILFSKEGYPDGIWYYEDMGFKEKPFMSPAMYRELIFPFHKKTIDFAHSKNIPVIMHSCGFIKPLLPLMIEAGIDCLQAIEIKAGMDLLALYRDFGDKISLMGGIDIRTLSTNDKKQIDRELEAKIPIVKQGYGYVLHSDHSIPKTIEYDTLCYFFDKGLRLGTYEPNTP